MMLATQLRHRINLESATLTRDAWGGVIETWAVIASQLPAVIVPLQGREMQGREMLAAQALQAGVKTRITIRYRSDVLPTMRVTHGTKIYAIKSVIPDPSLSRTLALMCEEGISNG